jgi:hypothetical protein
MAKSNFVKMLHNEEQLDLWKKKRWLFDFN